MSRIVYLAFPAGRVAGGHKMIIRHVETLRELGFEAVLWLNGSAPVPEWLQHACPVEIATPFRPDDVLVLPEDAANAIRHAAGLVNRAVIFCQNQFALAGVGLEAVEQVASRGRLVCLAPSPGCAEAVARLWPGADVAVVPAFADERLFHPRELQRPEIVLSPRKRPAEAKIIRALFRRLHPRHADLPWRELDEASEAEVAEALGRATLFLSLSRLESLGMTPLEAMASGCVCAGFLGVGGRDFASPANGFWVPDDDCFAAAEALAEAADLVAAGGSELAAMQQAGFETARRWSFEAFRPRLEAFWSRFAPEARTL